MRHDTTTTHETVQSTEANEPADTFDADAFESYLFLATSEPDWGAEDSDGLDTFEALARA